MAEIFLNSKPETTIVLNSKETQALEMLLADWIDDSYTRGIDCGDETVITTYRNTRNSLSSLFHVFGPYVWPED